MGRGSWIRIFLRLFVVSIVANAVLGIWALLSGDFGETQGRVLASSFLVSAAMLSVLVNGPAIRQRVRWPTPAVGAASGAAGFALSIVMVWIDGDDDWFRVISSLLVVAAAATLAASLALIGLPPRLGAIRPLVDGLIAALAVTILGGIWFEPDSAWYARLVGVEAVLVAALTLLIPVLSRFAGPRPPGPGSGAVPGGEPAVRFCPSCGHPLDGVPAGFGVASACVDCGLAFMVEAVEGTSPDRSAPAARSGRSA